MQPVSVSLQQKAVIQFINVYRILESQLQFPTGGGCRNQKRRVMRSSRNQTDGVRSRTPHPLMTPSFTI